MRTSLSSFGSWTWQTVFISTGPLATARKIRWRYISHQVCGIQVQISWSAREIRKLNGSYSHLWSRSSEILSCPRKRTKTFKQHWQCSCPRKRLWSGSFTRKKACKTTLKRKRLFSGSKRLRSSWFPKVNTKLILSCSRSTNHCRDQTWSWTSQTGNYALLTSWFISSRVKASCLLVPPLKSLTWKWKSERVVL